MSHPNLPEPGHETPAITQLSLTLIQTALFFFIDLNGVVVVVATVINYKVAVESNRFSSLCLMSSQLAVIYRHGFICSVAAA